MQKSLVWFTVSHFFFWKKISNRSSSIVTARTHTFSTEWWKKYYVKHHCERTHSYIDGPITCAQSLHMLWHFDWITNNKTNNNNTPSTNEPHRWKMNVIIRSLVAMFLLLAQFSAINSKNRGYWLFGCVLDLTNLTCLRANKRFPNVPTL